jgi:hypothetical protein
MELPPISDHLRTALDAVAEGGDHNETAFALLVADVRAWPSDLAARLAPRDWALLLAGGDAQRGEALRVEGRLVQRSPLEERWSGVEEWFLRDKTGRAICAFVVDPPEGIREGARLVLEARWYKRVDAIGRDGTERGYPAVVGRVLLAAPESAAPPLAGYGGLVATVIAMSVAYMFVRRRAAAAARRPRSGRTRRGGLETRSSEAA